MKISNTVNRVGVPSSGSASRGGGHEPLSIGAVISHSLKRLHPIEDRWAKLLAQAGRQCEPWASIIGAMGQPGDPEKLIHFLAQVDPKAALTSRGLRELRHSWQGHVHSLCRRLMVDFGLTSHAAADRVRTAMESFSDFALADRKCWAYLKGLDRANSAGDANSPRLLPSTISTNPGPTIQAQRCTEAERRQQEVDSVRAYVMDQLGLCRLPPEKTIWLIAEYSDDTQFRLWKTDSPKQSAQGQENFPRAISQLRADPRAALQLARQRATKHGIPFKEIPEQAVESA